MAKRPTLEEKIARLKKLRDEPHTPAARAELAKALADRSNYVGSRAAEIVGTFGLRELVPDLLAAFERWLVDPVKTDPQCLGKNAVAEALVKLGHDEAAFYRRGMCHFQPEPGWGKPQDSAAHLRGTCAIGLVQSSCGDFLDVLNRLVDLLADPEKQARVDAARAFGGLGRREAIPLLRLKVLSGDEEAEVIGACLAALLSLDAKAMVPFVAESLASPDPNVALEAAAALGECKEPAAFEALKACWQKHYDAEFKRSLLLSMGLARQPAALEFLLALIHTEPAATAADALAALYPYRFQPQARERAEEAVRANGHPSLRAAWEKVFGGER
jgi:HEAT repeat protein